MQTDILGYLIAIFVAGLGIYGYYEKSSVPSVVAGVIFGVLLAVGAYFTSQSPRKPLMQLIVLVILGGFMFFKWYKSGAIYPSGIVALASAAVFVINTILYFDSLKSQF